MDGSTFQWDIVLFFVLIISFILIIIFAALGRLNLTSMDRFGTWERECINFNKVLNKCVPNEDTGYGCLANSTQTYHPYIEYSECGTDVADYFIEEIINDCDTNNPEKLIFHKCVSRKRYGLTECIHDGNFYNVGDGYYEYVQCTDFTTD